MAAPQSAALVATDARKTRALRRRPLAAIQGLESLADPPLPPIIGIVAFGFATRRWT